MMKSVISSALVTCSTECATYKIVNGYDTVHFSYTGTTNTILYDKLLMIKANAAQVNDKQRSLYDIANHTLSVQAFGSGKYALVLSSPYFYIKIAKPMSPLPAVQVQIKSEAIFNHGIESVISLSDSIANAIVGKYEKKTLTRLDFYTDFSSDYNFNKLSARNIVSFSKQIVVYNRGGMLESINIGIGSDLMCRIYDKQQEIKKSSKTHWHDLWLQNGWNGKGRVFRCEFQLKRRALQEFDVDADNFLNSFDSMWSYLTNKWLRIVEANEDDTNKRRWSLASFWRNLREFVSSAPVERKRVRARLKNAAYKFTNGLSGIFSHMAEMGITDIAEGVSSFIQAAHVFHEQINGFSEYVDRKVRNAAADISKRIGHCEYQLHDAMTIYKTIYQFNKSTEIPF